MAYKYTAPINYTRKVAPFRPVNYHRSGVKPIELIILAVSALFMVVSLFPHLIDLSMFGIDTNRVSSVIQSLVNQWVPVFENLLPNLCQQLPEIVCTKL